MSTDLASKTAGTVSAAEDTHPGLARMIQGINAHIKLREINGEASGDFMADLLESILSAESIDDVFAAQDVSGLSGKDFTNRPFLIFDASDIEWVRSTKASEEGKKQILPAYARVKVTPIDDRDNPVTIACGGTTFVAVLWSLFERGWFDIDKAPEGRALMITSTDSNDGAYLSLKPIKTSVKGSGKK